MILDLTGDRVTREKQRYSILKEQSIIFVYYLDVGLVQERKDRRQGRIMRFVVLAIKYLLSLLSVSILFIGYNKQFGINIQNARAWKWEVES